MTAVAASSRVMALDVMMIGNGGKVEGALGMNRKSAECR